MTSADPRGGRDGGEPLLEAREVHLSFGDNPALRGASVAVRAGELLAVMGPSGSGKSTLLHCLAGILAPGAGEVWFDGRRIDTLGEPARSDLRRRRFGFVFQFGQLVPELTAEENVALPLLLNGARRSAALAEARGWFDRLDLGGMEKRRSGELSGGQAQRVALARGLVSRPDVVFADEPTGSLDSLAGEHVMELLVGAARDQGATVVLVTHEPRIAAYADREIIVRDGRVAAVVRGVGVIRLGVRLAFAGGREAVARLAMIAVAVAIGATLLLTALAGINAFTAQNHRYAWLETGYPGGTEVVDGGAQVVDPLWWQLQGDMYAGELIARVDVAATGPSAPVPPGIPRLPAPGEYYASPKLSRWLRDTPAAQLADRYPGRQVGVIGGDALASPDSLVIIHGRDVASLRADANPKMVTRISTTGPDQCTGECAPVGTDSAGMTLVLGVVAAALLFPVLIFIGGATRLSAARREQRLAAMRLIGATPRQISTISTVEAFLATVAGVAAGFVLFAVARPAISSIPFSGERFFTRDLSLTAADLVLVALGIPFAAAVAARIALRRVVISPLGVTRRVTPRSPRPRRMIVLAAGTAWMIFLAYGSDINTWRSVDQAYAYLAGVFSIMIGLVVAGPWLTVVGARLAARYAHRPARLIAARRLADDPRSAFRAVSGVVLAVFVATCATGIVTTIVFNNTGSASAGATANAAGTVVRRFDLDGAAMLGAVPEAMRQDLLAIPGVDGIAAVRRELRGPVTARPPDARQTYVDCVELVATPAFGRCTPGAAVAALDVDLGGAVIDRSRPMSDTAWPAVHVTVDELDAMRIDLLAVSTDGSRAAIERARTVLERLPGSIGYAPETIAESTSRASREIDRYRQLADVVLLTSLPIAGCSLAVSVAGSLAERRRPFSLLRLTGVPLATLRRIVGIETVVPLLVSLAVSAAAGFAAAGLFVRAQLHQTVRPPDVTYWVLVLTGVAASLAVVASTFPALTRLTGAETARND